MAFWFTRSNISFMAKSTRRKEDTMSEQSCPDQKLKKKSNFFLDCIRNISLFLGSNAHIVELSDIQEDLDGLSELSSELQELRDKKKEWRRICPIA